MDRNQVFATVKQYILNQLDIDPAKVTESAVITEDLGADSANLMMLIMDIETEFNITVDDDAISTVRTVGDVVDYLVKKA